MSITIYHNPSCGTSRNALGIIRASGENPVVIEYLKSPPDLETLRRLIAAMGISTRELLREKGTPYAALGLDDPKWSDAELLDFMVQHPILINRPVVVTPKGAKLCRPSEAVFDLLDRPVASFTKEDGEVVAPKAQRHALFLRFRISNSGARSTFFAFGLRPNTGRAARDAGTFVVP